MSDDDDPGQAGTATVVARLDGTDVEVWRAECPAAPDLAVVDAVLRAALAAKRLGGRPLLHSANDALWCMVDLLGVAGVLTDDELDPPP